VSSTLGSRPRPAVPHIGALSLGAVPRVVVSFTGGATRASVTALARAGLDVAELRVDRFVSVDTERVLAELAGFDGTPVLATIRARSEGGAYPGTESERLALYRALVPRVDALDVEIGSAIASEVASTAHAHGKLVVGSYHDFARTPDAATLAAVIARGTALGADVVKLATTPQDARDVRLLASVLISHAEEANLVVIGMGEHAVATRLLFPALGSLLTYAFRDEPTAPGQLSLDELAPLVRRLFGGEHKT
jgi:3-dehydroquinate dehydratase I